MKIEQIVNRFIVELEECALQNNVDECDDCIAKDNCTYRKEILSAISTLEQLAEPCVHIKNMEGEYAGFTTATCNGSKVYYSTGTHCPHCGRKVKYEE